MFNYLPHHLSSDQPPLSICEDNFDTGKPVEGIAGDETRDRA